jgi:hypothetical protein
MIRKLLSILLLLLFTSPIKPSTVAAQSVFTDNQKALIQDLQTAVSRFQQLNSYAASGDLRINEEINRNNKTLNHIVYSTFKGQVVKKSNNPDLQFSINTQDYSVAVGDLAPFDTSGDTTNQIDMIVTDGKFYLQLSNITPKSIAPSSPNGWARIDNLPAFSGSDLLNRDTYLRQFTTQISYPINEQAIVSIQELPPQSSNNQPNAKGLKVVFDGVQLFKDGRLDKFMDMFNIDKTLDKENQRRLMGQNAFFQVIYWVGVDDQMIHAIDAASVKRSGSNNVANSSSTSQYIDQMLMTSITFSDFNEPISIVPPI